MPKRYSSSDEYFATYTMRTEDGCLHWTGSLGKDGYGNSYWRGKRTGAHRLAWELTYGPLDVTDRVDHALGCYPTCCEISHLRVTTNRQNVRHRVRANKNNTSGRRNVYWVPSKKKWLARIEADGKGISFGKWPLYEIHVAEWKARKGRETHFGSQFAGRI